MYHIALCDDENSALNFYRDLINSLAKKNGWQIDIRVFSSEKNFMLYLDKNPFSFDLIVFDILLGNANGVEIAKQVREKNDVVQIIFLTTSKDFALSSFAANPFYYLVKNQDDEKFEQVLNNVFKHIGNNSNDLFVYQKVNTTFSIPIKAIKYFENFGREVLIVMDDLENISFYDGFNSLEKRLKPGHFARISRSQIVNFSYIYKVSASQVFLRTGETLKMSVHFRESFEKAFSHFLLGE
ncbi:MAG: LytTR family DNA-binding domain-containing protein [Bacilli bacterium]|jgi:DNA-binding LytR/AlgR family response regulator|nr:LytTR family DNA-binding domain-containing protein [Bacilli bacterium]